MRKTKNCPNCDGRRYQNISRPLAHSRWGVGEGVGACQTLGGGGYRPLPLSLFTTHRLREQRKHGLERIKEVLHPHRPLAPAPHSPPPRPPGPPWCHSSPFKLLEVTHDERGHHRAPPRQWATPHNQQIKRYARKEIYCIGGGGQQRPPTELQGEEQQRGAAGRWTPLRHPALRRGPLHHPKARTIKIQMEP